MYKNKLIEVFTGGMIPGPGAGVQGCTGKCIKTSKNKMTWVL